MKKRSIKWSMLSHQCKDLSLYKPNQEEVPCFLLKCSETAKRVKIVDGISQYQCKAPLCACIFWNPVEFYKERFPLTYEQEGFNDEGKTNENRKGTS